MQIDSDPLQVKETHLVEPMEIKMVDTNVGLNTKVK